MKRQPIDLKNLEISKGLLEYLQPEKVKPCSRLAAYHDLLMRASDYKDSVNRFGHEFNLVPGQFVVTYTELAKEWGWGRGAVKRFIDNLCSLGQLEVDSHVKCALIDVIALRFKFADHSDAAPNDAEEASVVADEDDPFEPSDEIPNSVIDETLLDEDSDQEAL